MSVSALSRIVHRKVIERDHVSGFFQALAGRHHQVVGFDGFQNLNHGLARRQQGYVVLQQHVAGAVDEGTAAIAQDVEPHEQRTVQRAARGGFGILGQK